MPTWLKLIIKNLCRWESFCFAWSIGEVASVSSVFKPWSNFLIVKVWLKPKSKNINPEIQKKKKNLCRWESFCFAWSIGEVASVSSVFKPWSNFLIVKFGSLRLCVAPASKFEPLCPLRSRIHWIGSDLVSDLRALDPHRWFMVLVLVLASVMEPLALVVIQAEAMGLMV